MMIAIAVLIARCVDAADVIMALNFGRDNNLPIAVRGGGHNKGVPRRRVAASLLLVGSHSRSIANRLRSANEQYVSAPS